MAFGSADSCLSKLAAKEGGPRFAVPELDFVSIEKHRLDGPPPLGDSPGESL